MSWWDEVESCDSVSASTSAVIPVTQLLDLLEPGKLMQYATTSHLHLRLVVCVLFNTHTKNKALILPEAQTCRLLRSETCFLALQSNDSLFNHCTKWCVDSMDLSFSSLFKRDHKAGSKVNVKVLWLQWFCCNSEYRQKSPVLLVHVYYKAVTWQKVISCVSIVSFGLPTGW